MLIGFGAGVLVVGYIVGKVGLHALAYAKKDLKGGVSFVTFIQIVSLLGQFKFEWPEGLKAFFGWFSVFKLNVAVALGVGLAAVVGTLMLLRGWTLRQVLGCSLLPAVLAARNRNRNL